jgi:tetratricopeptide (TPR) repeat protein
MSLKGIELDERLKDVASSLRSHQRDTPEKILEIIAEAQQLKLPSTEAKANFEMARFLLSADANYQEAARYIEKAIVAARTINDPVFLARVKRVYGTIMYYQNNLVGAQNNFKAAIDILDKQPMENEVLVELGENYLQLALLHKVTEFKDLRKLMAEKSLSFYTQANYGIGIGKCNTIFASIYFSEGRYDEALKKHSEALSIHQKAGNLQGASVALNNIGSCYRELGDFEKALSYLKQSLEIKLQLGNPNNIANSHVHIAEFYVSRKEYTMAVDEFLQAITIFERIGNKVESSFVYASLSEVYEALCDFENAYKCIKKHNQLQRVVFGFEKTTAIADALAKYEIDKRDKETELLRHKSAEIEEYAHKLEVSNRELEQYAHVASHDLKEPLRMIGSYIGLLQKRLEGKLNEEEKVFMNFVLDGTKRMDILISDLLEYSKLNREILPQKVALSEVIEVVKQNITKGEGEITTSELPVLYFKI